MMSKEDGAIPPKFHPPRRRPIDRRKCDIAKDKFGHNSKGIDIVVLPESSRTKNQPSGTPTSACSLEDVLSDSSNDNYLSLTGTIQRGRKSVESIDIKLQMSREELDKLEASIKAKNLPDDDDCFFGTSKGFHVFMLSLFCLPFVIIISCAYSFYFGTVTWYNILVYFHEERTIFHKVLLSPLLILVFPFYIISTSVGLGLYSAIWQVSWYYDSWKIEVQDLEKGFYGWICLQLDLVVCAPYEVIILENTISKTNENIKISLSKSENKISDTAL